MGEEVISFGPSWITIMTTLEILTDVADSFIVGVLGVECPSEWASSDHLQSFGKSLHGLVLHSSL
jgi:hypothetical protein